MHWSDWIRRLVSFDYTRSFFTVSRSRDGISARRAGRQGDGFTHLKLEPGPMTHEPHDGVVGFSLRPLSTISIVAGASIASLRYPENSVWSIGVFPKRHLVAHSLEISIERQQEHLESLAYCPPCLANPESFPCTIAMSCTGSPSTGRYIIL